MYVSRLTFHTLPGKTQEVEEKLIALRDLGRRGRWLESESDAHALWIIRSPDLVFEQEVENPDALQQQIKRVTKNIRFQEWARQVAGLLEQSSKRELYQITHV